MRGLLLLTALFVVAVLLVDPRGEFPLNDDWGVAYTTLTLFKTGRVEFTPFASATAYLQFYWGALWAAMFGPSFTVLRASTLFLSLATTLLVYMLLRREGVGVGLALFGAAAMLFHPLFFWASFTSMTHVPFVFLSVVSMVCFARAWEREGVWLGIALAATVASFFTRQFAILNAVAPLIVAITFKRRKIALTYVVATLFFGALAVSGVLVASQKELVLHQPTMSENVRRVAFRAVHYLFFNWQNAALFFAPVVLLVLFARGRPRPSWIAAVLGGLLFVYPAWRMISIGMPIPYMNGGNVFTDFGLGPPTLRDVFTLRMAHPFALPFGAKLALMIISAMAALFALSLTVRASREQHVLVRYSAVYLLCGTLIAAAIKINFDRYSIDTAWPLLISFVILASKADLTSIARISAAVALIVFMAFSVSATAEYLAWNRARWEAFRYLQANGVSLQEMDGGYEVNAMLAMRAGRKDLGKPGVGVVDDRYIIAFNRVPGYEIIRSFEYRRWLGLSRGWIHVERRVTS